MNTKKLNWRLNNKTEGYKQLAKLLVLRENQFTLRKVQVKLMRSKPNDEKILPWEIFPVVSPLFLSWWEVTSLFCPFFVPLRLRWCHLVSKQVIRSSSRFCYTRYYYNDPLQAELEIYIYVLVFLGIGYRYRYEDWKHHLRGFFLISI